MDDPIYSPQEREIFGPYWNGAVMRHADPLAAHVQLAHALDGEPGAWLVRARSPNEPERFEALTRVEQAAREVFGMVPFDPETGGGAQLADCLSVFKAFTDWVKKNGRNTPDSPTAAPPTDSPPPPSDPC